MTQPSPYFIRRTAPLEEVDQNDNRIHFFDEDEWRIDFTQYWRTVRKHLTLIIALCVGVTTLKTISVLIETPLYTASATILIKPGTPQVFGNQVQGDNANGEQFDYYENFNKTQYEILKSRSLAVSAIKYNGLEKRLTTSRAPVKVGWYGLAKAAIGQWIHGVVGKSATPKPAVAQVSPDVDADGVSAAAVGAYMGGLTVRPVPDTDLVRVEFTTPDPELSARLANAHAHAYIRQGIELHSQANEEAQKFLQLKLVELKEKLQKSEYALNRYRRDQGIVPGLMSLDGKETIVLDRLAVLSKDLTEAQVARLEMESQVEIIRNHQDDVLPQLHNDKMLQQLRADYDQLSTEYAGMAKQFKPDYPPLARLQARREEIQRSLDDEIRHVKSSIEAGYKEAQVKEQKLQQEMDKDRAHALGLNDAAVEYAILQREVDTNR